MVVTEANKGISVRSARQFLEFYTTPGYDRQAKEQCLKMYVNGDPDDKKIGSLNNIRLVG